MDSRTLNTSFIERLNLTLRQSSAYLLRRTLSRAQSKERLEEHLELLRFYYSFVRSHRALKFGREPRTPAMKAGLTRRHLTFREVFLSVIGFVLPENAAFRVHPLSHVDRYRSCDDAFSGVATLDGGSTRSTGMGKRLS